MGRSPAIWQLTLSGFVCLIVVFRGLDECAALRVEASDMPSIGVTSVVGGRVEFNVKLASDDFQIEASCDCIKWWREEGGVHGWIDFDDLPMFVEPGFMISKDGQHSVFVPIPRP